MAEGRGLLLCLLAGLGVGLAAGVGVAVGMVLGAPPAAAPAAPAAAAAAASSALPAETATARPQSCRGVPLRERAGQVLVVGLPGVTAAEDALAQEVLDVGVGGVFLTQDNIVDEWQTRRLVRALRRGSAQPLLVATDEEPGRVSSLRALTGPTSSARTLARTRTPAGVRQFARDLGEQLAALGIDANLAPVVDLDAGPAGGIIGDRAFSGEPDVAADYGLAFSAGLADAGVVPTVKHFPGHGRSSVDSHDRLALVDASTAELAATDLVPFATQVDAGVPLVMVAHVAYTALDPDLPASLSPATYDLLRDMGFAGVAITDSIGMGSVHRTWDFPTSAVMAVAAGADAVLATDGGHARAMRDGLVAAVRTGRLDASRLDEAAGRMLALKGVDPGPLLCQAVAPAPAFRYRGASAHPRLRSTACRQRAWRRSASSRRIAGEKRRSSCQSSANSSVDPHTPWPRPAR